MCRGRELSLVSSVSIDLSPGQKSGWREHRHRRPSVARLEDELDRLADADRVEVAIDDVGHHRRAFGKDHIGDAIRYRRPPHDAVGIDRPLAGSGLPLDLVAEAEWAVPA